MTDDAKPTATMLEDSDDKPAAAPAGRAQMPAILQALSEEELNAVKKRLLRKADLRLLPMMTLIYIMNYLDRCVPVALTSSSCNEAESGLTCY